jgi:hypothetical protein
MRRIALSQRKKFIALPVLILVVAGAVGFAAYALPPLSADLTFQSVAVQTENYRNPLVVLMMIYMVWNAYHFGMQNFGVLTIYRVKSGIGKVSQRSWDLSFCLVTIAVATILPVVPHLSFRSYLFKPVEWGVVALAVCSIVVLLWRERTLGFGPQRAFFIVVTALGPLLTLWWAFWANGAAHRWPWLPKVPLWPGLWAFALLSMNHWLVSIGLASHVFSRRTRRPLWLFAAAIILAGAALFGVLFIDFRTLSVRITAVAVSLRLGLGFVHFLYDRWLYKFSDPVVRATVGKDVFGPPER